MSIRREFIVRDPVRALLDDSREWLSTTDWPLPHPSDAGPAADLYPEARADWLIMEPRRRRLWICFLDLHVPVVEMRQTRSVRMARQIAKTGAELRCRIAQAFGDEVAEWPVYLWLFVHPDLSRPLRDVLGRAGWSARITPVDRLGPVEDDAWDRQDPRAVWDPGRPALTIAAGDSSLR